MIRAFDGDEGVTRAIRPVQSKAKHGAEQARRCA